MNRSKADVLLDAVYGMDTLAPDWTPLFAALAKGFRSHVVTLQLHDTLHRRGTLFTSLGLPDSLLARYETSVGDHPWFERGAMQLLSEGVADDRGLTTEAELKSTRFHADFMAPARVDHGMALCLHHQGPTNLAVLTVNREGLLGCYDKPELDLAHLLLPHLRNAYALQQHLGWLDGQFQVFRAALDHLVEGVLLLDGTCRVVYANVAAQRLEQKRLFACRPDGRLAFPWSGDNQELQHALLAICTAMVAAPLLKRIHDRNGYLVGSLKACPIGAMAGPRWAEYEVKTIAFLKLLADTPIAFNDHDLCQQWDLTPAEAHLAQRLLQGSTLEDAAEQLCVSKNTVRTHLSSLFSKTGTQRQAELVRVLLRLSFGRTHL